MLDSLKQNCEKEQRQEKTHQLFIAQGGGSHGRGDSSLTRVLYERLKTEQTEKVLICMFGLLCGPLTYV